MSFLVRTSFNALKTVNRLTPRVTSQHTIQRFLSSEIDESKNTIAQTKEPAGEKKVKGFGKSFDELLKQQVEPKTEQSRRTFAELLKSSPFIELGDPKGKLTVGEIVQVVGDDLYIDFGWKFNCVCVRPERNAEDYVRGALVRIKINELELSSRFLGSDKDLTILEADCTLQGIIDTPVRRSKQPSDTRPTRAKNSPSIDQLIENHATTAQ